MIIHSPESAMDEPYRSYVSQRSHAIAGILNTIIQEQDVQLCPRAITSSERFFDDTAIVYGAVVENKTDGDKSILYDRKFPLFDQPSQVGIATNDEIEAQFYAREQFMLGNRVRLKDATESDSRGQFTAETPQDIVSSFHQLKIESDPMIVLMPHLDVTRRISVGRITLGTLGNFYYAGEEFTTNYQGETVYGGTTLGLFHESKPGGRQTVEERLALPSIATTLGLRALTAFDTITLSADRVSVDVIEGYTDNGTFVRTVVDVTPRVGGTTPAEVLAIQEVYSNHASVAIARSQLLYNPDRSPARGTNFVDTDSLIINAEVLEVRL